MPTTVVGSAAVGDAQSGGDLARHPRLDPESSLDDRVELLLQQMSLLEKARQLHGIGQMRAPKNRRLGIPDFRCCDGPRGIGEAVWRYPFRHTDKATAFPVSIALASAWDPELSRRMASAIAREAMAKGRNWLLAPCVNIIRDSRAGRTQECFSEDPFLTAAIAVPFVEGIQQQGVIACVKHLACHNQEGTNDPELSDRKLMVEVGERALREIYLPAFRACVEEGGVWSVMSARTGVNGSRGAEHEYLLTDVLRGEWGFRGIVVGDWKTVEGTERSIDAGLDVEMPKQVHYGRALVEAVKAGRVSAEAVERAARRVLRTKMANGLFERRPVKQRGVVNCLEHRALALEVARASMVLLKNDDGVLPLSPTDLGSLAVLGPNAAVAQLGEDGSSEVRPFHRVSPLAGLRERFANRFRVRYRKGCELDGRSTPTKLRRAAQLAGKSDAAIVVVGFDHTWERESVDRRGGVLDLPAGQVELIETVLEVNPRTVVVIVAGGAVTMGSWVGGAATILHAWYPGEQGGRALADVLLGDVNPSARLPITFPSHLGQLPDGESFPRPSPLYNEGVFVGYRGIERHPDPPLFPFGHGLSYTCFRYDDLRVETQGRGDRFAATLTFRVTNQGQRSGVEIAQVYVRDVESSVERPDKELRAFVRCSLAAGESRLFSCDLKAADLSFYDVDRCRWLAEAGTFQVLVGSSSADIRLHGDFVLESSEDAGGPVAR